MMTMITHAIWHHQGIVILIEMFLSSVTSISDNKAYMDLGEVKLRRAGNEQVHNADTLLSRQTNDNQYGEALRKWV